MRLPPPALLGLVSWLVTEFVFLWWTWVIVVTACMLYVLVSQCLFFCTSVSLCLKYVFYLGVCVSVAGFVCVFVCKRLPTYPWRDPSSRGDVFLPRYSALGTPLM